MGTLELFEFADFGGERKTLTCDTLDLASAAFIERAQSLKVCGDPWIVFADVKYGGEFKAFPQGEYRSLKSWSNHIRSARIVRCGLNQPNITLYEHVNYGGKRLQLTEAANLLKHRGFNNIASSQKEVCGAWVLYAEENYQGKFMVTVTGDDIPNYHCSDWGDQVSSLKPITAHC